MQRAPPAEREEGHYRQQFPAQLQVLVTVNHALLARCHVTFSKKNSQSPHAAAFSTSIAFSPKLDADFPRYDLTDLLASAAAVHSLWFAALL